MPQPPNPMMRPGMPQQGGMAGPRPQPGQQQPQNPNQLKAQKLMLKAKLMMLEAQELMQGGGPEQKKPPQGQPPRR